MSDSDTPPSSPTIKEVENSSESNGPESLEDLQTRHRKEQRDLTNKITALKKTATKGDKKRKKEVVTEIALMEDELKQRHDKELKECEEYWKNNSNEAKVEEVTQGMQDLIKKPNRQKLRKERKQAEIDELRKQAELEASGMVDMKQVEMDALHAKVTPLGLLIKDVPADGHCLYNALSDQLKGEKSFKELRKLAAGHIKENSDDFLPFMVNDDGDMLTEDEFKQYLEDLESKAVWGGDLEIRALSQALSKQIHVYQMNGAILKVGEEFSGKPLLLTYHRHMYTLGEHYNSLITIE